MMLYYSNAWGVGQVSPLREPMALSNACLGLIKQSSKVADNASFLCNILYTIPVNKN